MGLVASPELRARGHQGDGACTDQVREASAVALPPGAPPRVGGEKEAVRAERAASFAKRRSGIAVTFATRKGRSLSAALLAAVLTGLVFAAPATAAGRVVTIDTARIAVPRYAVAKD